MPAMRFSATMAVHAADALFYDHEHMGIFGEPQPLNERYINSIGLKERLEVWRDVCERQLSRQGKAAE